MSTISAELQLKTGQFHAAFSRVDASLVAMQKRVVGVESAFKGFAFLGGASVAALAVAAAKLKSSFDLGGKLADLSANTGMTASEVLILRQAFSNAGLGADDLQGNIARLQKALAGTNEEGEATNAALQRLGLAAGQLDGQTATQQIQRLQQAFAAISDPAERTRTAMELFGKSGARMLAVLGDSSALSLAGEQVGALGALMDANAGKFDRISDSLNTLAGLKMDQLFSGFAAELSGSADAMEDLSKTDLTGVGSAVARAAENTWNFLSGINGIINKVTGLEAVGKLFDKIGVKTWGDVFENAQVESLQKRNSSTETNFAGRMENPADRASLMNDIAKAADQARAKLAAVDKEFEGYDPERIAAVKNELSGHISVLDAQAAALRAVGAAAEQSGAQQVAAAQMSAEEFDKLVAKQKEWAKERETLLGGAGKFWKDEELAAAGTPEARRKILTDRVGIDSVGGMDAEIARLQKSIAGGFTSNPGNEIASLKELMDTRRAVADIDRSAAAKSRAGQLSGIDKAMQEKQSLADQLFDPRSLPALQTWASATRQIGLGGGAANNAEAIARVQAERQREGNRLLTEIRELLKKRETIAPGELVFG